MNSQVLVILIVTRVSSFSVWTF